MPQVKITQETLERREARQQRQQVVEQAQAMINQLQNYRDALPEATTAQLKIGLDKLMENQQKLIRILAKEVLNN